MLNALIRCLSCLPMPEAVAIPMPEATAIPVPEAVAMADANSNL